MDRNEQRAILLALLQALDSRGSWCGETHVQKCTYFLQDGLGVPLPFEFILYKHGPFSFDLRQALGELRGVFLIEPKPQPYPYGPSLALTGTGDTFLKRHEDGAGRYARQIAFVADRFGPRSVAELERLGTALFVRRSYPGLDAIGRASTMVDLKPHIKAELASEAVEAVDRLLADAPRMSAPQGAVAAAG